MQQAIFNKICLFKQPRQSVKILQHFKNRLCSHLQGAVDTEDLVCCASAFLPLSGWVWDGVQASLVNGWSQEITELDLSCFFFAGCAVCLSMLITGCLVQLNVKPGSLLKFLGRYRVSVHSVIHVCGCPG
jgi:hypothetical protein